MGGVSKSFPYLECVDLKDEKDVGPRSRPFFRDGSVWGNEEKRVKIDWLSISPAKEKNNIQKDQRFDSDYRSQPPDWLTDL